MRGILKDVAEHSASSWKVVPQELTLQEIELMEAAQAVPYLPPTREELPPTKTTDQINDAVLSVGTGVAKEGPWVASRPVSLKE